MARARECVDGILIEAALYTKAGITKAIGIGEHTIAEWMKRGWIKPLVSGRGYLFKGVDVVKAVEADSKSNAA